MKELSVQISRMDKMMVKKSFYHCLTAALEDLALKDL